MSEAIYKFVVVNHSNNYPAAVCDTLDIAAAVVARYSKEAIDHGCTDAWAIRKVLVETE